MESQPTTLQLQFCSGQNTTAHQQNGSFSRSRRSVTRFALSRLRCSSQIQGRPSSRSRRLIRATALPRRRTGWKKLKQAWRSQHALRRPHLRYQSDRNLRPCQPPNPRHASAVTSSTDDPRTHQLPRLRPTVSFTAAACPNCGSREPSGPYRHNRKEARRLRIEEKNDKNLIIVMTALGAIPALYGVETSSSRWAPWCWGFGTASLA